MKKRKIASVLAAILAVAFMLAACAQEKEAPSAAVPEQSGEAALETKTPETEAAQWMNSSIVDSVSASTPSEKKDDFYLDTNHDWLMNTKLGEGEIVVSSFTAWDEQIQKDIMYILKDTSLNSHEAKLVQQFYNDYMDMETRNKLGVEPLQKLVDGVKNVTSIEEMTAYLLEGDNNIVSLFSVEADLKDSDKYGV